MVLTLYKLDASPPVRAVNMVIEKLKIPDVEHVEVNLLDLAHLNDDFIKMNPQHTIPTLKDDDFVIWDSQAIAVYLVTKYASGDSLYPDDLQKRAIINQRLHFNSGILFPALRGTAEPCIFFGEKAFRPENLAKIQKGYEFTEKFLTNTWLAGEDLTLADICCVSSISSMNEMLPIDPTLYPKLTAWLERCAQEDFYKKGNEPGLLIFRDILKSKLS